MFKYIPLLFAFASIASHAAPVDGNKLDEWTKAHERIKASQPDEKSGVDMARGGKIIGYVSGVVDAQAQSNLCVPDEVDLGQRVSTVEKWIEAHPEQWQQRGNTLVVLALSDAYPCPA